ncbi:uncharacterized protein LOC100197733 isoform X6 [Hydra vulgaris]|uniref:Uncharacterized protein LOC100197733 isoform X6 n=1 Tax=Hydra vulgaris TaxID=6087 RepID=A0ABM4C1F0_HYDVU
MVIKIFVIGWLLLLCVNKILSSGLCQQQAQSAFQLLSLGNAYSKEECFNHCCKRKECQISILNQRRCFGINCSNKNLCKVITEQLINFKGHRVDKRSDGQNEFNDNNDINQYNLTSNFKKEFTHATDEKFNNVYNNEEYNTTNLTIFDEKLIPLIQQKVSTFLPTSFPSKRVKRNSIDKAEDYNGIITNVTNVREKISYNDDNYKVMIPNATYVRVKRFTADYSNSNENDNENDLNRYVETSGNNAGESEIVGDNGIELQCAKSEFKHSTIPKRKKSYLFKQLHGEVTKLSDCSKKCCKTDECVLAFTIETFCYAVICSDDSNFCHSNRDKLPSLKILLAVLSPKKEIAYPRRFTKIHKKKKNQQENSEERHALNAEYIGSFDAAGSFKKTQDYDVNNRLSNQGGLSNQPSDYHQQSHDVFQKKEEVPHFDELSDDIRMLKYANSKMNTLQVDDDKMGNYNSQYESPEPAEFIKQQQDTYVPLPDRLHNAGYFNEIRGESEDFLNHQTSSDQSKENRSKPHLFFNKENENEFKNDENESTDQFIKRIPTDRSFKRHSYADAHAEGDYDSSYPTFKHSTVSHHTTKHISKTSPKSNFSTKKTKHIEKSIEDEGSSGAGGLNLEKHLKKVNNNLSTTKYKHTEKSIEEVGSGDAVNSDKNKKETPNSMKTNKSKHTENSIDEENKADEENLNKNKKERPNITKTKKSKHTENNIDEENKADEENLNKHKKERPNNMKTKKSKHTENSIDKENKADEESLEKHKKETPNNMKAKKSKHTEKSVGEESKTDEESLNKHKKETSVTMKFKKSKHDEKSIDEEGSADAINLNKYKKKITDTTESIKHTEKSIDEEGSADAESLDTHKNKKVKTNKKEAEKEDLILKKIASLEAKLAEKFLSNNTASAIQSNVINNNAPEKEKSLKNQKKQVQVANKNDSSNSSKHTKKKERHQIKKSTNFKKKNDLKNDSSHETNHKTEKEGSTEEHSNEEHEGFDFSKTEEREYGSGSGIEEDISLQSKKVNAVKATKKEVVGSNKNKNNVKKKKKNHVKKSKKTEQTKKLSKILHKTEKSTEKSSKIVHETEKSTEKLSKIIHETEKSTEKSSKIVHETEKSAEKLSKIALETEKSNINSTVKLKKPKEQNSSVLSKVIHEDDDEEGSADQKLQTTLKLSFNHKLKKTSDNKNKQNIGRNTTSNEKNIEKSMNPTTSSHEIKSTILEDTQSTQKNKSLIYKNTTVTHLNKPILNESTLNTDASITHDKKILLLNQTASTNTSQSSKRHHIPHKKKNKKRLLNNSTQSIQPIATIKKHKNIDVFKEFEKLRELYESGVNMKAHRKELKVLEAELIGSGDASGEDILPSKIVKVKTTKNKILESKKIISTVAPTTITTPSSTTPSSTIPLSTTSTTTSASTTTATTITTTLTTTYKKFKTTPLLLQTVKPKILPFKSSKLERKNFLHIKVKPTPPAIKKGKPTHKNKQKLAVTQHPRTVPTVLVDPETDKMINHTLNKTEEHKNISYKGGLILVTTTPKAHTSKISTTKAPTSKSTTLRSTTAKSPTLKSTILKVPTLNIAIGDEPEGPVIFIPSEKTKLKTLLVKTSKAVNTHKPDHQKKLQHVPTKSFVAQKKLNKPTKLSVKIKEIKVHKPSNKHIFKPTNKPTFHITPKQTNKVQKEKLKPKILKITLTTQKTTLHKPTVHPKPFSPLEKKLFGTTYAPFFKNQHLNNVPLNTLPTKLPALPGLPQHYKFFLPFQGNDIKAHHSPTISHTNSYFNKNELGNPLVNAFKSLQNQPYLFNQDLLPNNKKNLGESSSHNMDDDMPNVIGAPKFDNTIANPKQPVFKKPSTLTFKIIPNHSSHLPLNNPTKQQIIPNQKNTMSQSDLLKTLADILRKKPEHIIQDLSNMTIYKTSESHLVMHSPTLRVKHITTKGKPHLPKKPTTKQMSKANENKNLLSFSHEYNPHMLPNQISAHKQKENNTSQHNQKEKLPISAVHVNKHPVVLTTHNNTLLHTPTKKITEKKKLTGNKKESPSEKKKESPTQKKKESPLEVISRLLGNKNNSKTSALDDFFNDHKVTLNPLSSIHKSTDQILKKSPNKLESFFKKTEIKEKPPSKNESINHKNLVEESKSTKSCRILKDLKNTVFSNEHVGTIQNIPGQSNMSSCFEKCCHIDTCHVAMLDVDVCKLVHCSNHELCHSLLTTKRDVHLVFLEKNISDMEPKRFCVKQNSIGVPWEPTLAGSTSMRSCPRDAFGQAKRKCDIHAHWQSPDFSECTSLEYSNMEQKINGLGYTESARSLVREIEDITTQSIDNSMIFGGDLMRATKTITGIVRFITETKAESFDHADLKSFTKSISNMLDETNKQEWMNIQQVPGPSRLMNSLDEIGLYSAERMPVPSEMKPVITRSILLSVEKRFPGQASYSFPNYTLSEIRGWSNRRDSISVPYQAFSKDKETLIASANFKTLGLLLPHRHVTFTDGFVVNSNVISCSISPKPILIQPPVVITLHHLKEFPGGESKCVFWDIRNDAGGSWSVDGCNLISSNRTMSICSCNHLTHFAVLTHTGDQKVSAKEQAKEHSMAAMWLGIPLGILLIVASFYTCFTWSKAPRRRHVVIMDKKPTLPENEEIVTKRVSEKYPGSPDRYLYAANITPSPSELEWEHAWDFLANSHFNGSKKIFKNFKKEHSKKVACDVQVAWKEKETDSIATVDSQGSCFQWKHQDDFEWSKDRIKCLGRGLLNVSTEHLQCSISSTSFNYDAPPSFEIASHLDTFSPIAMSSPQSVSIEELLGMKRCKPLLRCNYLQISFDPDEEVKTPELFRSIVSLTDDFSDSINETINQDISLTDLTQNDISCSEEISVPSDDMLLNIPPLYSQLSPKKVNLETVHPIKTNKNNSIKIDQNQPVVEFISNSHIFNLHSFEEENSLVCKDNCCMVYLDKLFEDVVEIGLEDAKHERSMEDVRCDSIPNSINGSDQSLFLKIRQPSNTNQYSIMKKMYFRINMPKSSQFKSIISNTVKKSQREAAKDAKQTLVRTQKMHMKSYIALRQQCRMNEATKIPYLHTIKRTQFQSKGVKKISNIIKENRTLDPDVLDSVNPSRSLIRKRKSCIVSLKEQYPVVFKSSLNSPKCGKLALDNFQSEMRIIKNRSPLHKRKVLHRRLSSKNKIEVKNEVIKQPEDKLSLERKAFAGHLSRWQCEEHLP